MREDFSPLPGGRSLTIANISIVIPDFYFFLPLPALPLSGAAGIL
jgi:hypothetical protein